MKTGIAERQAIHFVANYVINPTNPLTVNLIGAGGTGSHVTGCLGRMNHVLTNLDHPGLNVRLWDDDVITEFNQGRQDFSQSELGLFKADVLIRRCNRKYGTDWKAVTEKFTNDSRYLKDSRREANIYITCVDNVSTRHAIGQALQSLKYSYLNETVRPFYWIDFGNSKDTGQVVLSTVGEILQPSSSVYRPVGTLPSVIEEYGDLLQHSEAEDDTPSCSMAEALGKQDLYINSTLAQMGCDLLYNMIRSAMTGNRGFFLNLRTFMARPMKIT